MKKIILCLLSLFLFSSCIKNEEPISYADMSNYYGFNGENYVFVESDVEDFLNKFKNDDTFVAYFGFSDCPWCNQIIQILYDSANEYSERVYYIDTRANDEESNLDIPHYDELVDSVGEYFEYDNDGLRHLYTPFVFFIKDGEVKDTVTVLDSYENTDEDMTDEEKNEQIKLYENGFESIGLKKS